MAPAEASNRAERIDWTRAILQCDAQGATVVENLLTAAECDDLVSLYDEGHRFRRRVVKARHGDGRGEYNGLHRDLHGVSTSRSGQCLTAGIMFHDAK